MDWFELTIRYLGIATLTVILMAAIGLLVLTVVLILFRYTPHVHIGRPKNDGELRFYHRQSIVTGKSGERIKREPRLSTEPLKIKWLLGLSRRNSTAWFVGIIRFEPKPRHS